MKKIGLVWFVALGILITISYITNLIYIIKYKNFSIGIIISLSITIISTISLYLIYKNYKKIFDFRIKVDEEGIYFKIPKVVVQYHELEVEKGKYLWKQIRNVIYDSESNIIYLILISKVRIPIPIINTSKQELENILREIGKYVKIEVM